VNPYSALAKFFKAVFFYRMSSLNGDLPMIEALKGQENWTPKYDEQKAIFLQIITWLGRSLIPILKGLIVNKGDNKIEGDIYFGGSGTLSSWRKVVNAFHLRVLIDLKQKEG
jgi:hypothetical protein